MTKKVPDPKEEIQKEKEGESIQKPSEESVRDLLTEKLKTRLPEGAPEAVVEAIFLDELAKHKE